MFSGSVDINSIIRLENGIHSFSHQMTNANSEIEHIINHYFQDFERGLKIVEERLRRAEEDLRCAKISLEHQQNKRVLVRNINGDGWHWVRADCSAEEARVAKCEAVCSRYRRDVETCHKIISNARSKRHAHEEKYSLFEKKIAEALERLHLIKEKVERHLSIKVPPPFSSCGANSSTLLSSSFATSISIQNETEISRPRPPIPPPTSHTPTTAPERPRSPIREQVGPAPNNHITEADRPRSPFANREHISRVSTSSFWNNLDKVINKDNTENKNE